MCKKEIFNEVLNNVCKAMDLNVDSVMHSNKEECVDARYLVIALLSEQLSDRPIAEVSGWSYQLVNKARNSFHKRCKYRFGLKELYKELSIFAEKK